MLVRSRRLLETALRQYKAIPRLPHPHCRHGHDGGKQGERLIQFNIINRLCSLMMTVKSTDETIDLSDAPFSEEQREWLQQYLGRSADGSSPSRSGVLRYNCITVKFHAAN